MSLNSVLNMARQGMNVQQTAVQIASQNIANATSEGYSRQRVEMSTSLPTVFPYGSIGTGVKIDGVTQARDQLLDVTYRGDAANSAGAGALSTAMQQVQSVLGEPSDTGLSATMDKFWSAWSDLANDPSNSAAKSVVRAAGANVATTLNGMAERLDDLDQTNREAMNSDVGQINKISKQIADLNVHIVSAEAGGQPANDLRDERGRLLDQITQITGGQVVERANGSTAVYAGGRMLVDGAASKQLLMNDGQPPTVVFTDNSTPVAGMGGKLGAEMDISATRIPGVMAKLDAMTNTLVTTVNAIHTSGQVFSGTPAVGQPAGNFFDVTTPAPTGTDARLTARGIRLSPTLTNGAAVATAGATATGPGNNDVALQMANLRTNAQNVTSLSGVTVATASIGDYFNSVVGDVATQTGQAQDDATVQGTLASSSQTRRESVSGVSTDEELIAIIQHQHAYQAAARLVSVVDEMTQTLVDLGR